MRFETRGMAPVQVRVLTEALTEYAARHDPSGGPLERLAYVNPLAAEMLRQQRANVACAIDMVEGMMEPLTDDDGDPSRFQYE